MNKSCRRPVIAGNWKMNMTPSAAAGFMKELAPKIADCTASDVVLCVPFVDIAPAVAATEGTNINIGAENVHFKESGAYTGEISANMLLDCGTKYVIVGHSERRQYFGETDETVRLRAAAAAEAGLKVIICVGEVLSERESGITGEILAMQTKLAFEGLAPELLENVIIAYEPVWAIGTGKTATAEQADEACALIRGVIAGLYGDDAAKAMRILYGGSMNAKNAAELLAKENVDGGLIGGASLKTEDFSVIVRAAE